MWAEAFDVITMERVEDDNNKHVWVYLLIHFQLSLDHLIMGCCLSKVDSCLGFSVLAQLMLRIIITSTCGLICQLISNSAASWDHLIVGSFMQDVKLPRV